jgi:ABC-type lipoprotein release transport system permease subunit
MTAEYGALKVITLRLAWRNLWRHKRRTWLTASAIAFITVLMVFLITLQLGSYDLMVDSSLRIFSAQMQVQREGYLDKPRIRKIIPDAVALAERLRADPALRGVAISTRAQAFALASSGTRSYGVQVVGAEPEHEPDVSTIPRLMKSGRYLAGRDAQEAVLGAPLAKNLNIQAGDDLTLLGSAMDGSMAATIVPVVGIFESGMRDLDRVLVEMPLGTFQELFAMGQGAHAIALLAPDLARLPQMHREVVRLLPATPELVVLDWDRLIPGLKQIIEADWTIDWFIYVALILVVTLSILNTFIMSVLERTHEFGIMLALGATPLRVGTLVFAETALLALIGLGIGIGIGFGIAAWLSVHGFTYPGLEEFMGQYGLPALIYPKLSAKAILIGPVVILGFILVAALYPAFRIRKLQPVEAIHGA